MRCETLSSLYSNSRLLDSTLFLLLLLLYFQHVRFSSYSFLSPHFFFIVFFFFLHYILHCTFTILAIATVSFQNFHNFVGFSNLLVASPPLNFLLLRIETIPGVSSSLLHFSIVFYSLSRRFLLVGEGNCSRENKM